MRRRDFIFLVGGGALSYACSGETSVPAVDAAAGGGSGDNTLPVDANGGVDACTQKVALMHDTYAQALYLDGTNGPLTGVIEVASVIAGVQIMKDFWHGHGGQLHRFTLTPADFEALKRGERITVGTTMVDGHSHTLFVDPQDERYRVPNAPDVEVALGC